MDSIIQIELLHLAAGYGLILLILLFVRIRRLGREWEIALATFRMTIQLVAVGYILEYVFSHESPWITVGIFVLMEGFAVYTVFGRLKGRIYPALKPIVAVCMVVGTSLSLSVFLFVIVQLSPWFDPRYFIPIAGMIIGNSMNGVSIGIERLSSDMKSRLEQVEGALMLGATPKAASAPLVREAFGAGIMVNINNMMGMGIVFLPGMMTGQILSGVSPVTAIEYQIAIMIGIAASVSITTFLATELGYRKFFNDRDQIVPELYRSGS